LADGIGVVLSFNIFKQKTAMDSNLEPHPPHYHYPLVIAQEDTRRWRKKHIVHAFAVDKQELLDVIGEVSMDAIRFYFGYDDKGHEKMFLVGAEKIKMTTEEDGEEIIYIKDLIDPDVNEDGEAIKAEHYVYDFTNPCPSVCDPESPLMN
jgi:hypothetical protein